MDDAPAPRRPVKVDQALHGYDRGHRLLESSRQLDGSAGQLMLSMSDLLTSALLPEGASYVAGYPLKETTSYVVARTWPASEMPRPGSVWTHSLIVGYEALTTLADPTALVDLLERPIPGAFDRFSKPLALRADARRADGGDPAGHPAVAAALAALYAEAPAREVAIATADPEADEDLALALWRQMWPALRRDSAFVTAADPLQAGVDAGCVVTFARRRAADRPAAGSDREAIEALLADLPEPGPTELRAFISRHAFDAPRPRAAAAALVRLWTRLPNADLAATIASAEGTTLPTGSPRLARDLVERALAAQGDGDRLRGLVRTFGGHAMRVEPSALERSVAALDAATLGGLLDDASPWPSGTFGDQAFVAAAGGTPVAQLAEAPVGLDGRARLLPLRPELAREGRFWPTSDRERAALVAAAAATGADGAGIVACMAGGIGPQTTAALIRAFPDDAPAALLERLGRDGLEPASVAALAGATGAVEAAVAAGAHVPPPAAEAVLQAAFAAGVVARPPQPFWLRLADGPAPPYCTGVAAVGLAAALSDRKGPRARIAASFAPVHEAASRWALPGAVAEYLDAIMQDLRVHRWPLSEALEQAAISAYAEDGGLSPDVLGLADDPWRLDALIDAIRRRRGADALRELSRRVEAAGAGVTPWKAKRLHAATKERKSPGWFWF